MSDFELKDIDPEDLEDLLKEVETSFDIKFVANELTYVKSFGELCDHIANKIQLEISDDCTSQQAFYKLREAISACQFEEKRIVKADYPLNFILPRALDVVRNLQTCFVD